MAEHRTGAQEQLHHIGEGVKGLMPEKGPSGSQVAAVVTLLPIGGVLLALSGLTFAGTLAGLAAAAPLFLLFSPILVPAAIVTALAVTGFLTAGAFSLTAFSSISWLVSYLRGVRERAPEFVEHAKRRVQEAGGHVEQRAKEAGQRRAQQQEGGGAAGRT